jgi:2-phospho-L-lactate/phosphoenolpyruvate guanylyltransferase
VLVVVGDTAGEQLAAEHGARSLREPRPGLQAALAAADTATAGAHATLVVAADLPLARGEDLDRVCAAGARQDGPAVVVAPTEDGGTGALYRRPPGVVATAFGPGSAAAHLALGQAAGAHTLRLRIPRLALDVDTAEGLDAAAGLDARTRAFAAGLGRGSGPSS